MAQKVLVNLDFAGNQIMSVVLHVLASDPTCLGEGHMYYNSTTNKVRISTDGSTFSDLGSSDITISGTPTNGQIAFWTDGDTIEGKSAADTRTALNVADGATANDTDANLKARANHTGTQLSSTISDFNTAVDARVNLVVDGAPGALDTLNELAAALNDDADFAGTMTTNLATKMERYAVDVGNGSDTAITVTHNLGSLDVLVQVYEKATGGQVIVAVERSTTNAVILTFASAPASNAYRCVVMG